MRDKAASGAGTGQKEERSFELERIVFFSDAVFAIAITLLAIELKVPQLPGEPAYTSENLWKAVVAEWPQFLAFFLSFAIIAAFWVSHHRYFRFIVRYDGGLIFFNFLVLFFVALLPYFSGLLGEYGDLSLAVILYSANLFAQGMSSAGLWRHATSHQLVSEALEPSTIRMYQWRAFVTPIVALLVIVLALVFGSRASLGLFLIFVFQRIVERRYK